LKQAGKSDKLTEVLEEVPRVRADAGYPPLVTPSSQIVGTQAVFNVIGGERYKMVTKEFKGIVQGQYGKAPVDIDPEFVKKIIGDTPVITCRPADNLAPELDELRAKIAQYIEQDEDVLSYALFEQVAIKFFEYRKAKKYSLDAENSDASIGVHAV
jgi:oxaloacetate decarboxylase alpha subunit